MGVRLRPINQSWTGIYNSVADLIVEAGRARAAGIASMGASIGGGLSHLGTNIRSSKAADRAQANVEADNERADRAEKTSEDRYQFGVDKWKFDTARGMVDEQNAIVQANGALAQLSVGPDGQPDQSILSKMQADQTELDARKKTMEAAGTRFFQRGGQPPEAWMRGLQGGEQTGPDGEKMIDPSQYETGEGLPKIGTPEWYTAFEKSNRKYQMGTGAMHAPGVNVETGPNQASAPAPVATATNAADEALDPELAALTKKRKGLSKEIDKADALAKVAGVAFGNVAGKGPHEATATWFKAMQKFNEGTSVKKSELKDTEQAIDARTTALAAQSKAREAVEGGLRGLGRLAEVSARSGKPLDDAEFHQAAADIAAGATYEQATARFRKTESVPTRRGAEKGALDADEIITRNAKLREAGEPVPSERQDKPVDAMGEDSRKQALFNKALVALHGHDQFRELERLRALGDNPMFMGDAEDLKKRIAAQEKAVAALPESKRVEKLQADLFGEGDAAKPWSDDPLYKNLSPADKKRWDDEQAAKAR